MPDTPLIRIPDPSEKLIRPGESSKNFGREDMDQRIPDQANTPLMPIKPPPGLAVLARVRDALETLPCLN